MLVFVIIAAAFCGRSAGTENETSSPMLLFLHTRNLQPIQELLCDPPHTRLCTSWSAKYQCGVVSFLYTQSRAPQTVGSERIAASISSSACFLSRPTTMSVHVSNVYAGTDGSSRCHGVNLAWRKTQLKSHPIARSCVLRSNTRIDGCRLACPGQGRLPRQGMSPRPGEKAPCATGTASTPSNLAVTRPPFPLHNTPTFF